MRILFVGGDLERKGGLVLLEAFRRLRGARRRPAGAGSLDVHLDLVTQTHVPTEPGVSVHHGLRANSQPLKDLYHAADIFCLPTMGDCLPMVLSEAGAAGLPLVSTAVGAIAEIVRDDETGLLVPVADADALEGALRRLVADAALRRRLGAGAHALVHAQFDAETNAHALLAAPAAGRLVRARGRAVVDVPGRRRRVLLTVSGTIPDRPRRGGG